MIKTLCITDLIALLDKDIQRTTSYLAEAELSQGVQTMVVTGTKEVVEQQRKELALATRIRNRLVELSPSNTEAIAEAGAEWLRGVQ